MPSIPKMTVPKIEIGLSNQGTVNKNKVTINGVALYFSYETLVGVWGPKGRFISENDWSNTTGKFLNELEPDKKARVSHEKVVEEAQQMLQKAVSGV